MTDESGDNVTGSPPAYSEALTETRRVLDVQREMIENTDTEIVSLIRLDLLSLGGIITLTAYVPELVAEALLWVVLASLCLISSVLIAAFIYRGVTIYAGFGDHGVDSSAPPEKLRYETLIAPSDHVTDINAFSTVDPPASDTFRAGVLNEHQLGISHNNIEIKYRSQIHQQVIQLMLVGLLMLGIGLATGLANLSGPYELLLVGVATVAVGAFAIYTIVKSLGLIGRFIQTKTDPNRLSYGYGFERQYPYLSRLCLVVLRYLYDPNKGDDW